MEKPEKIPPVLSKIKKESPFRVPDNYFDDFQARLQAKIEDEEFRKIPKKERFSRILKPIIGLAAGFALIFTLVRWPISKFTEKQTAGQISTDEMYYSLLEEMDENSLCTVLENSQDDETVSDEALANYLVASLSEYDLYMESN